MISDWYFKAVKLFCQMELVVCADLKVEFVKKQGKAYDIPVKTVDEILSAPEIRLVRNRIPHQAHYAVAQQTLNADKYAYKNHLASVSRKPKDCWIVWTP